MIIHICKTCKEQVKFMFEVTIDLRNRKTWPKDFAFYARLIDLSTKNPYITKVKVCGHYRIVNYHNGARQECGPVVTQLDIAHEIQRQIG